MLTHHRMNGRREIPYHHDPQEGRFIDDMEDDHSQAYTDANQHSTSSTSQHEHHHHHHHYIYNYTTPTSTADHTPRQMAFREGHHMHDHHPRGMITQPSVLSRPMIERRSVTRPGLYSSDNLCGCGCCVAAQYHATGGQLGQSDHTRGLQGHRVPLRHGRLVGM